MANAQLLLSGRTIGSFDDLGQPNTTVTNAPDGSAAHFATGIPVAGSVQSSVQFTSSPFANPNSGDVIHAGLLTITNGRTEIGSGAPTAMFNLGIELATPSAMTFALTPITIHIDHTINTPAGTNPDEFSVSFAQPAPMTIDNYHVQFWVNFDPAAFEIREDFTRTHGEVTVSFTPIPEPSTYAACGALLLFGLVGYRRFRSDKVTKQLTA